VEAGPLAVAVVDDDEWRRRGLVDGVRELGDGLTVAGSCDRAGSARLRPTGAGGPGRTGGPDAGPPGLVVLVAADTPAPAWDRLAGFRTAGDLRRRFGDAARIVVLADDLRNPLLAVRAIEAGADHLYPRSEVHDLASLRAVLLAPDGERRPATLVAPGLLRAIGVTAMSRLSAGLDAIEQRELTGLFDDPPSLLLSRRRSITLRRTLATTMAVQATTPPSATRDPAVRPTWQQLRRVVDLARGADHQL
jgi:hypothetical protein